MFSWYLHRTVSSALPRAMYPSQGFVFFFGLGWLHVEMFGQEQNLGKEPKLGNPPPGRFPFKVSPESKIHGSGRQCATRDEGLLRDLAQELDSQMSLVNFSKKQNISAITAR